MIGDVPINRSLLNEGENVVVSTRTHPKALLVPLLVLVVLLAVGTFVERQTSGDGGRVVAWVVWAVVAIGALRYTLWPFLEWLTGHYTFTDRRLITRTGVLTRRGHDIALSRVSDVAVELHLTDRMLGCGTLVVSDASTHGQVVLPDIPHVEEVQRRLQVLLHQESARDERA